MSVLGTGSRSDHSAAQPVRGSVEPPPRSIARNLFSLATSQVITWGLALAWTFFVPRLIGPKEMGLLTIATSVTAVVAVVLSLLTKDFLVREMVRDRATAPRLVTLALLLRLASLPLVFLAGIAYGRLAGLDGHAMTVLFIVSAGTVCVMLAEPALATFQATERMQYIAYTDVTNKSLLTFGGVVLALSGFGVVAIAGLGLAVAIFVLAASLWWVRRLIGLPARPAPPAPVVGRAVPYWFVAVFFVAYLWADGLLLGILAPSEVVGWYGAATRLFTTMMFVAVIIATSMLPRLVAAYARHPDELYAEVRRPFQWVLILGLPIGIGLASIADSVVPFIYGPAYIPSAPALAVLGLGLPLMYVNIVVGQVFVASGRPLLMGKILAAAAVVNVSLNLLLIPWADRTWGNGAVGAALALLLTELAQVALSMILVGRRIIDRATLARVLKAAAAALGMGALLLTAPAAPLALRVSLGAVAFVVLALLLRLPDEQEQAAFRTAVAKVRGRVLAGRNSGGRR